MNCFLKISQYRSIDTSEISSKHLCEEKSLWTSEFLCTSHFVLMSEDTYILMKQLCKIKWQKTNYLNTYTSACHIDVVYVLSHVRVHFAGGNFSCYCTISYAIIVSGHTFHWAVLKAWDSPSLLTKYYRYVVLFLHLVNYQCEYTLEMLKEGYDKSNGEST